MYDTIIRIELHGSDRRTMWYRTTLPFVPSRGLGLWLWDPKKERGGGSIGVSEVYWDSQHQRVQIDAGEEYCPDRAEFAKTFQRFTDCGWSEVDPRGT